MLRIIVNEPLMVINWSKLFRFRLFVPICFLPALQKPLRPWHSEPLFQNEDHQAPAPVLFFYDGFDSLFQCFWRKNCIAALYDFNCSSTVSFTEVCKNCWWSVLLAKSSAWRAITCCWDLIGSVRRAVPSHLISWINLFYQTSRSGLKLVSSSRCNRNNSKLWNLFSPRKSRPLRVYWCLK